MLKKMHGLVSYCHIININANIIFIIEIDLILAMILLPFKMAEINAYITFLEPLGYPILVTIYLQLLNIIDFVPLGRDYLMIYIL